MAECLQIFNARDEYYGDLPFQAFIQLYIYNDIDYVWVDLGEYTIPNTYLLSLEYEYKVVPKLVDGWIVSPEQEIFEACKMGEILFTYTRIKECIPGDRICDENFVYECNLLGTAYDVLIEWCSNGCKDGACIEDPPFCTPGARICKGNDIYECNTGGTAYDEYIKTCPTGTHCTNGICIDDPPFVVDTTTIVVGMVGVAAAIIIAKEIL